MVALRSHLTPAHILIFGFLAFIATGTTLLMLPFASTAKTFGFVDALFTSTSASCVTGLVVVDTGRDLSPFGQWVVLILIQVGGLGIMTMSTLVLLMAHRRLSLTGRALVEDTLSLKATHNIPSLLIDVVRFTIVFEGLGTILLFLCFLPRGDSAEALYFSIFHAVSAFCNAGFSVFSNSFSDQCANWSINLIVCFLVLSGGIGFPVMRELKRQFVPYRNRFKLSLHSKLVLLTTSLLLIFGCILILLMEWHNTLSNLPVPQRFLAALFHSVSARTAGFNTLQVGNMANGTLFVLILFMFIGASPGSCGGGIKTTTFATLIVLGLSRLIGRERPQVFRRTISEASVAKAISLVMISIFVVIAGVLFLLMTELGELSHPMSRGKFLELLFETVSAFGTVGLSTGATNDLTGVGKVIVTVIMFVGRVGPLAIVMAVSRRKMVHYQYAEEGIMIG